MSHRASALALLVLVISAGCLDEANPTTHGGELSWTQQGVYQAMEGLSIRGAQTYERYHEGLTVSEPSVLEPWPGAVVTGVRLSTAATRVEIWMDRQPTLEVGAHANASDLAISARIHELLDAVAVPVGEARTAIVAHLLDAHARETDSRFSMQVPLTLPHDLTELVRRVAPTNADDVTPGTPRPGFPEIGEAGPFSIEFSYPMRVFEGTTVEGKVELSADVRDVVLIRRSQFYEYQAPAGHEPVRMTSAQLDAWATRVMTGLGLPPPSLPQGAGPV